jgi:hypothetical protein
MAGFPGLYSTYVRYSSNSMVSVMALSPKVLEARMQLQVALLRELAARTAVEWGRATLRERYAKSGNPILQALARHLPPSPPPPSVD